MKYNSVLERPVWTSKSFRETFNIQLPKSNMNCYDASIHIIGLSVYPVFNSVLVPTINHIRNNMLGTTFNYDTLKNYLVGVYTDAKNDGALSEHEIQTLSHIFTEMTESTFLDHTSIGSKIASNEMIKLTVHFLGEVRDE